MTDLDLALAAVCAVPVLITTGIVIAGLREFASHDRTHSAPLPSRGRR